MGVGQNGGGVVHVGYTSDLNTSANHFINLTFSSNFHESSCKKKIKNFTMSNETDNLTISTKSCNHISLVKLHKNKSDNTITVDITSTNRGVYGKKAKEIDCRESGLSKKLFALTFSSKKACSSSQTSSILHGIRAFAIFWILYSSVESHLLSSSSSKIQK